MTDSKVVEYLVNNRDKLIERPIRAAIDHQFNSYPCIVILGPRQIGKSTLARIYHEKEVDTVYCDLENKETLAEIGNGIKFFKRHTGKLIILDEIQENEDLFLAVKCIIDEQRYLKKEKTRFLLLGSASLEIQRRSSSSLLGRCAHVQMTGLSPIEVIDHLPSEFFLPRTNKNLPGGSPKMKTELYSDLIDTMLVRGGLPDSLLARSHKESKDILQEIFESYVQSDLKPYGLNVNSTSLSECLNLIAKSNGQQYEIGYFTKNLDLDRKEVTDAISALEQLLLVRRLKALNGKGQYKVDLSKHPKLYIRDTGLLAQQLGVGNINDLISREQIGGAWEGFAIETIIATAIYSGVYEECHHFRTYKGNQELDLVLSLVNGENWGIEVKYSPDSKPNKGNIGAITTINVSQRILVHSGLESSSLNGGFIGLPLVDVLDMLRKLGIRRRTNRN